MGLKVVDEHTKPLTKEEQFIQRNHLEWKAEGMQLQERRLKHDFSLASVGERLGTSGTRISKLEKGLPVRQAKQLIVCYNLLFDHIELKKDFRSFYSKRFWRV